MASFTLQLTDGTTTIDFDGTDGYSLIDSSWAPQRAQRNESEMGPVYEDVIETIPIVITGGSPAHVMERYAALSDLLDQAEVWGKDDAGVDAVLFKYQPNGSTLADPLETPIWREPGSPRMLSAPSTTNEAGYRGNVLTPVIVTFTRIGLLLGATETEVAPTSTGNPAILTTATFTDSPEIPVPYDAYIAVGGVMFYSEYVFMATANSADKLMIVEGESFDTDQLMTPAVVAGTSAGSVMRTDTGQTSFFMGHTLSGFNTDVQLMAAYCVLKNNSSTISFTLTPEFVREEESITIAANDTDIQIVKLGMFSTPATFDAIWKFYINITSDASVTGGNELDIDYVLFIGLDDSTNIIQFINDNNVNFDKRLYVEHRQDSKKTPIVYAATAAPAATKYPSNRGPTLLSASGGAIFAMVWGVDATDGQWVITETTPGGTEQNIDFSATRTMGYLTPL